MIEEIEGATGLYEIKNLKVLYEIGYAESVAFIRNIDSHEVRVRKIEKTEKRRRK